MITDVQAVNQAVEGWVRVESKQVGLRAERSAMSASRHGPDQRLGLTAGCLSAIRPLHVQHAPAAGLCFLTNI